MSTSLETGGDDPQTTIAAQTSQSSNKRPKKASRVTPGGLGSASSPPVAPINKLPYEIRQLIISYLDDDAFTLLHLLLVSKVWYTTLTRGKQAEEAWARRCQRMGVKNKCQGQKTWRGSYVELLHRRCVCCFARRPKHEAGSWFLYGFTFLRLCHACLSLEFERSGPMQLIYLQDLANKHPDLQQPLIALPNLCPAIPFVWTVTLEKKGFAALRTTFHQAHIHAEKESAVYEDLVRQCRPRNKKTILRAAFAHVAKSEPPKCEPLEQAVSILRHARPPTPAQYADVVTLFEALRSVVTATRVFFEEHDVDPSKYSPDFTSVRTTGEDAKPANQTFIDAMVTGDLPVADYLQTVLQNKNDMERTMEEQTQAHSEYMRERLTFEEI